MTTTEILTIDMEFTNITGVQYDDADLTLVHHAAISTEPGYTGWHKRLAPKIPQHPVVRLRVDRAKPWEDHEVLIMLETPLFGDMGQLAGIQRGGVRFWVSDQNGRLVASGQRPSTTRYSESSNPERAPTLPSLSARATSEAQRLMARATVIAREYEDANRAGAPLVSPIK